MLEWIKSNADILVASSAAIISLASFYVAKGALHIQREHNYRSVRPLLHISWGDYEDKAFLKLINYGAGPLIIDSLTVHIDQSIHKRVIDALGPLAELIVWDTFTDTVDGRALSPNAEFILLEGTFDDSEQGHREKIRAALAKMTLKVSYKDIYDRPQASVEKRLEWFSRE